MPLLVTTHSGIGSTTRHKADASNECLTPRRLRNSLLPRCEVRLSAERAAYVRRERSRLL